MDQRKSSMLQTKLNLIITFFSFSFCRHPSLVRWEATTTSFSVASLRPASTVARDDLSDALPGRDLAPPCRGSLCLCRATICLDRVTGRRHARTAADCHLLTSDRCDVGHRLPSGHRDTRLERVVRGLVVARVDFDDGRAAAASPRRDAATSALARCSACDARGRHRCRCPPAEEDSGSAFWTPLELFGGPLPG